METFRSNEQAFTDAERLAGAAAQPEANTALRQKEGIQSQLEDILRQKEDIEAELAPLKAKIKLSKVAFDDSAQRAEEIRASKSPDLENPDSPLSVELAQAREDKNSYDAQMIELHRKIDPLTAQLAALEIDEQDLRMELSQIDGTWRDD